MLKPSYINAVEELVGRCISGPVDGPIENLIFHDDETPPTEEAIQVKLKELQDAYDAKQYQRDRATAYPNINDQLDMQYWDEVNGTSKWQESIAKVKSDHPKPAEGGK